MLTYGASGTYGGFDGLGRIQVQKWEIKGADPADVRDQFEYGYDRDSNRLYRKNVVASTGFDELYHADDPTPNTEYDGLDRLTQWRRGTLDGEKDGLTSAVKNQTYALDALGNWRTFVSDTTAQDRDHDNDANEITAIDSVSTHVAHDAGGNMSRMPVPGDEANHHDHCVYDAWNRLAEVREDDDETVIVKYRYDGLHRRIRKMLPQPYAEPYDSEWIVWEHYYNEAWQMLEERTSIEVTAPESTVGTSACAPPAS